MVFGLLLDSSKMKMKIPVVQQETTFLIKHHDMFAQLTAVPTMTYGLNQKKTDT